MKLDLDVFLDIAEHFERVYFRFYENATILVSEDEYCDEINEIIKQMLVFTFECSENYSETNLSQIGLYAVVELKEKGKEYNFTSKNLGLYFSA